MALAGMSAAVQAYQARLDALEQMRIPALEERVQEVSRSSAEVQQQSIASLYQHSELMCLHLDAQQLSHLLFFHSILMRLAVMLQLLYHICTLSLARLHGYLADNGITPLLTQLRIPNTTLQLCMCTLHLDACGD